MKIVIAPNAFKESLSAWDAARAIEIGLRRSMPRARLVLAPIADGGDGTAETLARAAGGRMVGARVSDPLGRPIRAEYAILGDGRTAVVEMASASGLRLLRAAERNPMRTSTAGTGELIRAAVRQLCKGAAARKAIRVIVGIGGSATVDGGAGMASALGFRLLDSRGEIVHACGGNLGKIVRIDPEPYRKWLATLPAPLEITVACDVTSPLLGPNGAARVFGPQKGATPSQVERLEANMAQFAEVVERDLKCCISTIVGGGAAGGLGAGLVAFLGAEVAPGAGVVADALGLERMLRGADWLITGEGRLDAQTACGKAPAYVGRLARKHRVGVIALAGSLGEGAGSLGNDCFDAIFSICDGPRTTESAMKDAYALLAQLAESVGATIRR